MDWDKQLDKGDRVAINSYMQSIVKDVTSMHKILTNILPKQSIEVIFGEIFRFIMKLFDEVYMQVQINTKYGKKRIKVDLKYFSKNIKNIKLDNEDLITMLT